IFMVYLPLAAGLIPSLIIARISDATRYEPRQETWYNGTQRPAQIGGGFVCVYKEKLLASSLPPKWRIWSSGSRSCDCGKRVQTSLSLAFQIRQCAVNTAWR